MTESEAKGFIQGKLDCMKKCDIFNKEDNTSDNDCDNCKYCYSQGNFGNQKEAFSMAINALEKQIAKKPIEKEMPYSEDVGFNSEWNCPCCNSYIGYFTEGMSEPEQMEYCNNCGQHIAKDWSDKE